MKLYHYLSFLDRDSGAYDRKWYSHTPNYYFPKTERYPDLKTTTVVFMISTLGLIILITTLIILLYRMSARARHQRELQNHLQTISELLDNNRHELPDDEPPVYEAPPDYDEVIKVGMDDQINRKQSGRKSDRNKNKSGSNKSKYVNFYHTFNIFITKRIFI